MNKKILSSLLLMGLIVGCSSNDTSSSSSGDIFIPNATTSSSNTSGSNSQGSANTSSSGDNTTDNVNIPSYGSLVAPTEGYALYITQSGGTQYYVSLTHIEEKDGQGRDQYYGDNIELNSGDIFKMYNGASGEDWAEKVLEPYGQYANFTVTDDGIVCNVTGVYDIYAKFMWEDNTIYIGNQDGQ